MLGPVQKLAAKKGGMGGNFRGGGRAGT